MPEKAKASPDKVVLRGLDRDKVYATSDVDNVDTFTGNLMQRIPLGPELKTNGALKYQFQLVYNSRAWDHIGHQVTGPQRAVFDIGDYAKFPMLPTEISGVESIPLIGTNAGLGWTLTVGGYPRVAWDQIPQDSGTFYPRVSWISPDGAIHDFYRQLHELPGNAFPDPRQDRYDVDYYTRDGSYLRMRSIPPNDASTQPGPDPQSGEERREIQTPDGITYRIECVYNCGWIGQQEWYVTEIRDKLGAKVTFERSNDGHVPYPSMNAGATVEWVWTIKEWEPVRSSPSADYFLARQHFVVFDVRRRAGSTTDPSRDYNGNVELLVKRVRLNIGAPAGPGGEAVYELEYLHPLLYRDRKNTWSKPSDMVVPFAVRDGQGYIDAALLKSVTLPANESGSPVTAGRWEFRYYGDGRNLDGLGSEDYPVTDLFTPVIFTGAAPYQTAHMSGLLAEVNYPTGRGYQYDYTERRFLRGNCRLDRFRDLFESMPGAVRHRRMTRPVGSSGARAIVPGSTWSYIGDIYHRFGQAPPEDVAISVPNYTCDELGRELTSIVVEPEGKATATFYSQHIASDASDDNSAGWTVEEYGLPISRAQRSLSVDPADPNGEGSGMLISQHVYDCRGIDFDSEPDAARRLVQRNRLPGQTPVCGDLPLRETYLEYESTTYCETQSGKMCVEGNPRVVRTKTVYHDVCDQTGCRREPPATQAERWVLTTNQDFDGLGHFRTVRTKSNFHKLVFPQQGNDDRTTTTGYNPGVTYNPSTHIVDWGAAGWIRNSWILETYDAKTQSEVGGGSFRSKFAFNHENGVLEEIRTVSGSESVRDLRTTFTRSVEPDRQVLIEENYYGGDYGTVSQPEYTIKRRSWLGTQSSVKYTECSTGNVVMEPYSAVIAPLAAVPTQETDGAGRTYDYTYDPLLRVRTIQPEVPGGAAQEGLVTHSYPPLQGLDSELLVTTTQKGTGTALRESTANANDYFASPSDLDGMYLREQTRRKVRTGVWGQTEKFLNPRGWVRGERTAAASANEGALTVNDYDIFGRVVRVRLPQPNQAIIHVYTGPVVDEVTWNGVAMPSGDSATRKMSYDAFGRMIKVDELGIGTKSYKHDAADHLVEVSGGDQTRTFVYDYRGLLTSEQQPELANREYRYTYDARANVRRRLISVRGSGSIAVTAKFNVANGFGPFDLRYRYDGAERLIGIDLPAPAGGPQTLDGKPFKSFVFQPGANGKLASASRVNYVDNPLDLAEPVEYGVDLNYEYDQAGRLQARTLSGGGLTARVTYGYDAFDTITKITYPGLNGTSRRDVNYGYDQGTLISVTQPSFNFISNITYYANGFWDTISRASRLSDRQTVTTTIGGQSKMLPRPARIETPGRWDTSTIVYDVAGNIQAANYDNYFFDAAFRLKQADVKSGPSQRINLIYTYDENGNITNIQQGGTTTSFGTFPNNRLQSESPCANCRIAEYDVAGNLTGWKDRRHQATKLNVKFDGANMATRSWSDRADGTPLFGRVHVYDAFDERVGVIDYVAEGETLADISTQPTLRERWSVRGAANELLTDFAADTGHDGTRTWRWERDYVHAMGRVIAEIRPRTGGGEDVLDQHWDHLGSVRCVTLGTSPCRPYRKYLPFGEQIAPEQPAPGEADSGRLRFSGHERDDEGTVDQSNDLDYMHARMSLPAMGRFLSPDPVKRKSAVWKPQQWNRYLYATDNPVSRIDPDGLTDFYVTMMLTSEGFHDNEAARTTNAFLKENSTAFTTVEQGNATPASFQKGLNDSYGVSIYLGHSNLVDSLKFSGGVDSKFSSFKVKSPVVVLAACNTTSLLKNFKPSVGQAVIGVSSSTEGGRVTSKDLSYIAMKAMQMTSVGATAGEIVDTINAEFAKREGYRVRLTLKGDRNALGYVP